ncbi:hypothetical protein GA0070617_2857 [Micromonospora yangpuensis]|uniref:Uncharacterized protein n=1 Tax=Micromonospora yangpuensis TaxID=683228 RepID=A0A1C6UM61_9ACTN|nr:hypothetical protein GA0070617_2857 [Micromonospora yangpuensis]
MIGLDFLVARIENMTARNIDICRKPPFHGNFTTHSLADQLGNALRSDINAIAVDIE